MNDPQLNVASRGRVLMISPHFPPDNSAAVHRVRLLAPALRRNGWTPSVLAVHPDDYEGRLDPELAELVPGDLPVIRCRAWPVATTRRLGFGDLGLRAFHNLRIASERLMRNDRFDVVFITIYPAYPALLGPRLKRRYGVAVVLDYQDPWVGSWGKTVGGRRDGRPDIKSRLARMLGLLLERRAVRAADAITAVSTGTYEQIRQRYGFLDDVPCAEIPIGWDPADFSHLSRFPRQRRFTADGAFHLCSVGTLAPLGVETLRAVLQAVSLLKTRRADLYERMRLHFFGTTGRTEPPMLERVAPVAREIGVADRVSENAARVNYLDALALQMQASALLVLGSSEPHYAASRVFPVLLARRPVLAVYHEHSDVVAFLRRATRSPTVRIVTYDDEIRPASRLEAIYRELVALLENGRYDGADVDGEALHEFNADVLAGRLAAVLDAAVRRQRVRAARAREAAA